MVGGKKRRRNKMATDVDWEDFIIETLLLHQVEEEEEEEIDKGHYNTLLDLHVCNCGNMLNSYSVLTFTISHVIYPPDAANVSQIKIVFVFLHCSQWVAPELSPQQNKNVNLTTHESSMIGVDIDPKKGLRNKNSLAHQYCMEPVGEKHNDLLLKKKDNVGTSEKLNVSVMKTDTGKKPFPTEIPVVVDPAEKDSSLASLFCGVNKSDDERWDGQEDLSTPVSLDGYHSCMKEGETTNHVNATADKSNLSNKVSESEDYVSIADSVKDPATSLLCFLLTYCWSALDAAVASLISGCF
ncbi:Plant-specific TFIIB-related protein PTF2 [Camellia lanceoleosa]|uniref:Plant-specific TFIIB-related protein PTF2 n=1 Tax=Camellia lanceoleosa TaxID=1840588 RepID=A0ACC0GGU1_9ERIC|nr:Plant-specific TFIIB-related protein PTF2 [Camellia lanceoleosa]